MDSLETKYMGLLWIISLRNREDGFRTAMTMNSFAIFIFEDRLDVKTGMNSEFMLILKFIKC